MIWTGYEQAGSGNPYNGAAIAIGSDGKIYTVGNQSGTSYLWQTDSNTGLTVAYTISTSSSSAIGVCAGPSGYIFVADEYGYIWRFTIATNTFTQVTTSLLNNAWVYYDGTWVWGFSSGPTIYRINPATLALTSYSPIVGMADVTSVCDDGAGNLWAAARTSGNLYKIPKSAPATATATNYGAYYPASGVCFDGTYLWVAINYQANLIYRTTPAAPATFTAFSFSSDTQFSPIYFDGTYVVASGSANAGGFGGGVWRWLPSNPSGAVEIGVPTPQSTPDLYDGWYASAITSDAQGNYWINGAGFDGHYFHPVVWTNKWAEQIVSMV